MSPVPMPLHRLLLLGLPLAACAPRAVVPTSPVPSSNASAPVAPAAVGRVSSLQAVVDSIADSPAFANAHWGVLIVDPRRGDTLAIRHADKLFLPASNQKLLTAALALASVDTAYRWRTDLVATGPVRAGTLDGDLVVVGRGDPTWSVLGGWPDATAPLRALADTLAARGVRRIGGTVRLDTRAFPGPVHGFGWDWDDLAEPYGAGVGALLWNDGIAAARDSAGREVAQRDPHEAWRDAFVAALRTRGIAIDGRASRGTTTADTLVVWRSPMTLGAALAPMLKPSQNQWAEAIWRTVALERSGVGAADSARALTERWLARLGVEATAHAVRDGSGLSRHDYVTPRLLVTVLESVRRGPHAALFRASLPVGGVDGTLDRRMRDTPLAGRVRAKTGTVDKARNLSGMLELPNGDTLVFALLANNFSVPSRVVDAAAETILARALALRSATP